MKKFKRIYLTTSFICFSIFSFSQSKWACFPNNTSFNFNSGTFGMFKYTDGTTWLFNKADIYIYNGVSWKVIDHKTAGIQANILNYFVDSKHTVWIWSKGTVGATSEPGPKGSIKVTDTSKLGDNGVLTRFDGKNWMSWTNKQLGINANYVTEIYESSVGDIWIALADHDSSIPMAGPGLLGLALDLGTNAVIKAVRTGGLLQYTNGKWISHLDDLPGRKYRFVSEIYETPDQKIWFSTESGKSFYFENEKFNEVDKMNDLINNFDFGKRPVGPGGEYDYNFYSKKALILTNEKKIAFYNGKNWLTFDWKNGLSKSGIIYRFREMKDGSYVIVAANGIYKFDGADKWNKEFAYSTSIANLLRTYSVCDGQGRIWLLHNGDLGVYDSTQFKWELQDKDLTRFFIDRENRTWAATKGMIWLKENDSWVFFENIHRAKEFLEDNSGLVWISTENDGVMSYSNGKWETYNKKNGLRSSKVLQMYLMPDNNLWVITDEGICKFNRN